MPFASGLLALTLGAVSHGQPAPPAADDEARIEALVGAERATQEVRAQEAEAAREEEQQQAAEERQVPFPPPPGTKLAFDDLERMKGRAVRLRTTGGRTREGEVQEVRKNEVWLRSRLGGGYAEFALSRKQIVEIEAR